MRARKKKGKKILKCRHIFIFADFPPHWLPSGVENVMFCSIKQNLQGNIKVNVFTMAEIIWIHTCWKVSFWF